MDESKKVRLAEALHQRRVNAPSLLFGAPTDIKFQCVLESHASAWVVAVTDNIRNFGTL